MCNIRIGSSSTDTRSVEWLLCEIRFNFLFQNEFCLRRIYGQKQIKNYVKQYFNDRKNLFLYYFLSFLPINIMKNIVWNLGIYDNSSFYFFIKVVLFLRIQHRLCYGNNLFISFQFWYLCFLHIFLGIFNTCVLFLFYKFNRFLRDKLYFIFDPKYRNNKYIYLVLHFLIIIIIFLLLYSVKKTF